MSGALFAAITAPVVAALITVVNWAGDSFFLYAWGLISALMIGLTVLYPVAIAPLFNRFSPLPENSSLRARIIELAQRQQFPVSAGAQNVLSCDAFDPADFCILQLSKVVVMDGSARSAHSNAYFVGLCGAKQIVL